MGRVILGVGAAQAVVTNDTTVRSVRLVPAAVAATAILYSAGTPVAYLSAPANGPSDSAPPAGGGGNPFEGIQCKGPITADVVGTGAHLEIVI